MSACRQQIIFITEYPDKKEMKHNNKRIIKYLLLANIIILGLIAAGVFLFPGKKELIESLVLPYSIVKMLIIYTEIFLPVSAGSVFFVFILTEKKDFSPGSVNFFVSSLNIIIIPLFAVYSFLVLYLNPLLMEKKIWFENLSDTAGYYKSEINRNKENDIEKAYIFTSLYLYIDPDSEEINKINDDIYIRLLNKDGKIHETDTNRETFVPQLLTGQKLIDISRDFLERNDYSSAIYYSELAGKFSGYRKSSEKIIDRAETVLKQYVETDPDKKILYNGKLEIEDLYSSKNYIESYYRTVELIRMFPEDSELKTHRNSVLEKINEISFFYEDIESFIFIPGKENIIFKATDDEGTLIINFGKIVFADNDVYLFNINTFCPETGKSWKAPFGKLVDGNLNMNCIGMMERKFYLPEVKGSREKLTSIPLRYSGEDLINFSGGQDSIEKISLHDLVTKTEILINGKFGADALIMEASERIIKCINFIMILFISVYSGISFMKRGKGKNYLSLLLFPLVLFTAAAADFLLFNINVSVFENLIMDKGRLYAFILFPLLIIFEFVTSIFLTVKRSNAEHE